MPNVSVSWTGGVSNSVYIDVNGATQGPYQPNSWTTVTVPDSDGRYQVRPWCGSSEAPNWVTVANGSADPSSISCNL